MIAALYIDPRGPYPKMPGVDCWDEARDATRYQGPAPIVAHPPCGAYGSLRHLRVPRRDRRDDSACGPRAAEQVRAFGGVLEQPAGSLLWRLCGIPTPGSGDDEHGGFSIEVEQVEWGHPARKRTWLYLVRVPRALLMPPPWPRRQPTHWVSGGRDRDRKGSGGVVPPGIKVCSAQQRRRTPPAFAAWLVELARGAAG